MENKQRISWCRGQHKGHSRATTAGEFIDGEIEEGSIVMMLLDMNRAYFKMEFLETSRETSLEDANKPGITEKETFTNPAFIIATGGVSWMVNHLLKASYTVLENPPPRQTGK